MQLSATLHVSMVAHVLPPVHVSALANGRETSVKMVRL